ncbi:MAG TPA: ketoacyl-ACP synthase III family protein [Longimicrobiales bacterium]|nr:ketoacyl-ACP synthase III family protein [Longimicrobiales bacterium]
MRIAGAEYALGATTRTVRELARAGQLQSDAALLERFGFGQVCIAADETPYELARHAVRLLLDRTAIDAADIGLLIYGGPHGPTAFVTAPTMAESGAAHRTTARFRFPAARLQHELGLDRAMVIGVDQLACTTMFGAVRMARALCIAEDVRHAICVCADFYPPDAGREAIWNCTSDAAAAVLVTRGDGALRIAAATHVTKGYYWDPDARRNELVAAYFPTARSIIERTIAEAGWTAGDVSWILPHNVSRRSWDVLQPLAGLHQARLWDRNIARLGHTLAGDNFINLADALAAGDIERGQRLLLFSYGYGAHWTALAVEA